MTKYVTWLHVGKYYFYCLIPYVHHQTLTFKVEHSIQLLQEECADLNDDTIVDAFEKLCQNIERCREEAAKTATELKRYSADSVSKEDVGKINMAYNRLDWTKNKSRKVCSSVLIRNERTKGEHLGDGSGRNATKRIHRTLNNL